MLETKVAAGKAATPGAVNVNCTYYSPRPLTPRELCGNCSVETRQLCWPTFLADQVLSETVAARDSTPSTEPPVSLTGEQVRARLVANREENKHAVNRGGDEAPAWPPAAKEDKKMTEERKCTDCGDTLNRNAAKGLCGKCYARWRYHEAHPSAARKAPARPVESVPAASAPATASAPKPPLESRFVKSDGETVLAACEINEAIIEAVARGDVKFIAALHGIVRVLAAR